MQEGAGGAVLRITTHLFKKKWEYGHREGEPERREQVPETFWTQNDPSHRLTRNKK